MSYIAPSRRSVTVSGTAVELGDLQGMIQDLTDTAKEIGIGARAVVRFSVREPEALGQARTVTISVSA